MRSSIILALALLSLPASALTLSPMNIDEIVFNDFHMATFKLENTSYNVTEYDVTVLRGGVEGSLVYRSEVVLGGKGVRHVKVPISDIKPDVLEKYYVCIQEKGKRGDEWSVVGRVCAKLRLYWPRLELAPLT